MVICDCEERVGIKVDSYKLFEDLKSFFEVQVQQKVFSDIKVRKPYYIGYDGEGKMKWYADKWYKCKSSGTLWEFRYPDFPALGFVRKFEDGIFHAEE